MLAKESKLSFSVVGDDENRWVGVGNAFLILDNKEDKIGLTPLFSTLLDKILFGSLQHKPRFVF